MRQLLIFWCLVFLALPAFGQFNIKGMLADSTGQPVSYATIALLSPKDSTLMYYGISDISGMYIVKGVKADTYLVQVAAMEYQTWYSEQVIDKSTDLGKVVLRNKAHLMNEVEIVGEKIPLLLKGDTVEYNADAYKTRPDAVTEDLLKKLPGVEVDRAGNIKAQGEQVNKVLVDGKEFFGNDPKVATKNLPADAIKKVQVYNGKSDQAQFSGIDDGTKEKTINLELKEGKKHGYFGSLMAGGGTGERYQLNGKVYRFRKKSQFALMGMMNNINEFGFTMDDYMNFQGGLRGLMDGNGNVLFRISSADNLPVNFGQTVTGLISSGAGGINYSYEPKPNKRFNVSYLGNASSKQLEEESYSRNFTPTGSFERDELLNERTDNHGHRLNVSMRNDIDSAMQLTLNGGATLSRSRLRRGVLATSYMQQVILNKLDGRVSDQGSTIGVSGRLAMQRKWQSKTPLLKLGGSFNYSSTMTETDWLNSISYPGTPATNDMQFQDDRLRALSYSANSSVVRALGKGWYTEPELVAGSDEDGLKRVQGLTTAPGNESIDSLSPSFIRRGQYIRPGVGIHSSSDKGQVRIAVRFEAGTLSSRLNGKEVHQSGYGYILPSLMWRKELSRGKRLELNYDADVQLPSAMQMLPVANSSNPLQVFRGNVALRPEYQHQARLHWLRFDEFSFSSLFANISLRYTYDKINWSRQVAEDLSQKLTMVNVQDDYVAQGGMQYSTPIRKLGITVTASLNEEYQEGINLVNNESNKTTVFTHGGSMKIANRKKDKWDANIGASIDYTDARYSIQSQLNNRFYTVSYFGELSFRPSGQFSIGCDANIDNFYSESFNGSVNIPLVSAEATWFFLKQKRGSLTLKAFDLLNANTGLQRMSEMNYIMEKRSNIIGQYYMLSFKYRLSRSGDKGKENVISIGR